MGTTFFVLALLQCALLFFLSRVGSRFDREERKPAPQRTHWPRTGLIVPAGGTTRVCGRPWRACSSRITPPCTP